MLPGAGPRSNLQTALLVMCLVERARAAAAVVALEAVVVSVLGEGEELADAAAQDIAPHRRPSGL